MPPSPMIGTFRAAAARAHSMIARTIGTNHLVDELVVAFTHTTTMDFMLPGVEPTGRPVELLHVVSVGFERDKIAFERVYWDQASLLAQIGLLDPAAVPTLGAEQARKVLADRS